MFFFVCFCLCLLRVVFWCLAVLEAWFGILKKNSGDHPTGGSLFQATSSGSSVDKPGVGEGLLTPSVSLARKGLHLFGKLVFLVGKPNTKNG